MTAAAVLLGARQDGLSVRLDRGALKVEGATEALARWVPQLRAVKPDLLRLLGAPDPDSPPRRLYLIRAADGSLTSHSFTPPATLAEVAGWYPTATSIEPEDDSACGAWRPLET